MLFSFLIWILNKFNKLLRWAHNFSNAQDIKKRLSRYETSWSWNVSLLTFTEIEEEMLSYLKVALLDKRCVTLFKSEVASHLYYLHDDYLKFKRNWHAILTHIASQRINIILFCIDLKTHELWLGIAHIP